YSAASRDPRALPSVPTRRSSDLGGKYCTFPHAIELLNKPYSDVFTILTSYRELENYLSPFMDAWKGGAMEQLQGQIASAKIPLSDRKSTRLNSSHVSISYAVFCL